MQYVISGVPPTLVNMPVGAVLAVQVTPSDDVAIVPLALTIMKTLPTVE
jgi:hypothetical protein